MAKTLEVHLGSNIYSTAEKAKSMSIIERQDIEFDFNGIKCVVNSKTNLDHLHRHYTHAHIMGWKVIGPVCSDTYTPEVQQELEKRQADWEQKKLTEQQKATKAADAERRAFEAKTAGLMLDIINQVGYDTNKGINNDPYGSIIYAYADAWGLLMQAEIASGKTVAQCASDTSHQLSWFGITGFGYGAAVSILSEYWKHGEELRKWHNGEYGHKGDGVVNPATINTSTTP